MHDVEKAKFVEDIQEMGEELQINPMISCSNFGLYCIMSLSCFLKDSGFPDNSTPSFLRTHP